MARLNLGVTDFDWYQHLSARADVDEVNFWSPGGAAFKVLAPGDLFVFKLKAATVTPSSAAAGSRIPPCCRSPWPGARSARPMASPPWPRCSGASASTNPPRPAATQTR